MVPNPSALRWSKLLAPSRGNGCPGRKDRPAGSPHQKPQFPFSYLSGLCISVVKFPPCSFVIVQESTSASRRHAKLGITASRNKNARIQNPKSPGSNPKFERRTAKPRVTGRVWFSPFLTSVHYHVNYRPFGMGSQADLRREFAKDGIKISTIPSVCLGPFRSCTRLGANLAKCVHGMI